jgi:hypothetical protein
MEASARTVAVRIEKWKLEFGGPLGYEVKINSDNFSVLFYPGRLGEW